MRAAPVALCPSRHINDGGVQEGTDNALDPCAPVGGAYPAGLGLGTGRSPDERQKVCRRTWKPLWACWATKNPVQVTSGDGGLLTASMTALSIGLPEARINFGDVALTLLDLGDGRYEVGVVPAGSRFEVIDSWREEPVAEITFADWTMSGVWSGRVHAFETLDFTVTDIVATNPRSDSDRVDIDQFLISLETLARSGSDLVDQVSVIALEGLEVQGRGQTLVRLDRGAIDQMVAGYNLDLVADFYDAHGLDPLTGVTDPTAFMMLDEEAIFAMLGDLLEMVAEAADDMSVGFEVRGLHIAEEDLTNVGQFRSEFSITDMGTDRARIGFDVAYGGNGIDDLNPDMLMFMPPEIGELVPTEARVGVAVEGLPPQQHLPADRQHA